MKLFTICVVVFVAALGVGSGVYIALHTTQQEAPPAFKEIEESPETIVWKATPELMQDLALLGGERAKYAQYFSVGTFAQGPFTGGDMFILSADYEGPEPGPAFYRMVRKGESITLLTKYSDDIFEGDGLRRQGLVIDTTTTVPALELPSTLVGRTPRQVLAKPKLVNSWFTLQGKKAVFTHPVVGDVYTDMDERPSYESSYGPHERSGGPNIQGGAFYVRLSDGTTGIYEATFDLVTADGTAQLQWDNGTTTRETYQGTDRGGCGSINYASVQPQSLLARLTPRGRTTQNDVVYEFKDSQDPTLKIFYNGYHPMDEATRMSYEQFSVMHPLFFWVDPFGRLIKFQGTQFIPLAECGKPVIYLYPEKPTTVRVKIEPKGGMSFSEPVYNGEWVVHADPQGNLIEVSSEKTYPYLFWEGRGGIYQQPTRGFVVAQQDVHSFLIEKLSQLGLNTKEAGDFMEFWEPRMQGAPWYFVTFMGNSVMNELAPLTIFPKPDTVIRILMDFTPLQKPIEVQGFTIHTPQRKGFTVVEWGGVLR